MEIVNLAPNWQSSIRAKGTANAKAKAPFAIVFPT